jgi:hydroxymethylglutaryl-CoA reductase
LQECSENIDKEKDQNILPIQGNNQNMITGFSKLDKMGKLDLIIEKYFTNNSESKKVALDSWYSDEKIRKILDEFSENTVADFHLPFGLAPNVLIDNNNYVVPMVTEESSVVAAASKAAKYWFTRGGFKTEVVAVNKIGQVHLIIDGDYDEFFTFFETCKKTILSNLKPISQNMDNRGGGITKMELRDCRELESGYVQVWMEFDTCDAMGANFINTILEAVSKDLELLATEYLPNHSIQVVMSILSNYTPECLVKAWVECPIEDLAENNMTMNPQEFVTKFQRAVRIAEVDVNRATTHNKGIMNGIDSVVMATGNDFRAVEAGAHTYASRSGQYKSLTSCFVENNIFKFEINIPLAVGTVGGLTALHPMSKFSLSLLQNPDAKQLMSIIAVTGLAQNFAAVKSLVTTGIQKGHMKMHLMNILNHLEATKDEREAAKVYFLEETISFNSVRKFLETKRSYQ